MRRSLALLAVACTAMVTLAFLVPLAMVVREAARSRAIADGERQAAALVPVLAITTDADLLEHALASVGDRRHIAVHLPDGSTLGTVRASAAGLAEAARRNRAATVELGGGRLLLRPVVLSGGRNAVIEVFVPPEALTRGVGRSWAVLAGLAVLLVAGSVLVTDRLGTRLVRATRRLGGAASALGAGDLSVRVEPAGPPELVAAGRAFNAMADRVVALLAAERELAADLSHRLRTPLAALQLEADAVQPQEKRQWLLDRIDRVSRELNTVITELRRPRGASSAASSDLDAVVRERVDFWAALAEDQDRAWRLDGAGRPAIVPLHAEDVAAAVDALLENVLSHTPEGTPFRVHVWSDGNEHVLVVEDDGPGLPADADERGVSRGGSTGLGLDIVRRTAERTGGRLELQRSASGGARLEVRFGTALVKLRR